MDLRWALVERLAQAETGTVSDDGSDGVRYGDGEEEEIVK
jgi:hypothetical protein